MPAPHKIVILGGGTGGTLTANRLHKHYGDDAHITVVDVDDHHVYQPGFIFVPFGLAEPERLVRSRSAQLRPGIHFILGAVDRVETAESRVLLEDGTALGYDVLVIASGVRLIPEETEGLTGPGWNETAFTFYTLEGATALRDALASWDGGRFVVDVVDMPIKCPVAPLELAFLADWYFTDRGIRDRVEIVYATPLDGAFTKPIASKTLGGLLEEKGIHLETEFAAGEVDGTAGLLKSWDEREIPYDILATVPLHGGAEYVERSPGLGDELGFIPADQHTMQAKAAENVFVIGDAANLPTSKAGSVTHFEGETVVGNIERFLDGKALEPGFDGHANCFIETGFSKALLIDFNYETEPLPGRFPEPHVGPLPLLKESRLNHMGKLMFEWVYWHVLLQGREMPGISDQMQMAGKHRPED
jgi:sulfide:quinone oxidoreductase